MNLNFIRIFVFIILYHKISTQDKSKCKQGLLSAYGIPSFENPQPLEIYMCPNIKNSCCPVAAQRSIFNNWIVQGEGIKLKNQLDNYLDIYRHFLDNLEAVHDQAENLLTKLEDIKYSNCKVMADKIIQFKVEIVATKLKQKLNEMYEFFRDSFKGIYCTLCDYDQQKYFDMMESTIQLNQQFCRDILVHSLPNLLYFHSDFTPFMNLTIRYLSNCDGEGNYKKNIIPKQLKFTNDPEIQHRIKKCKNFVASEKWFLYCQPICQKFHPAHFNNFFHPHIQKFENFSKFVVKKITEFEEQEEQAPPSEDNQDTEEQQKVRILTSKVPKKTQVIEVTDEQIIESIKDFTDIKEKQIVFQPTINGEVDLNEFEVDFEIDGINFYEIGQATILDEAMLKKAVEQQTQTVGQPIQDVPVNLNPEEETNEQQPNEQEVTEPGLEQTEAIEGEEIPAEIPNEPARLLMNGFVYKITIFVFIVILIQQGQLIQNSTISNSMNSIDIFFCVSLYLLFQSNFFIFKTNKEFLTISLTYYSINSF